MKTALLVDTESLYHEINERYKGRLSYSKFLTWLKETYHYDVQIKHAYGNQNPAFIKRFRYALQDLGFQLSFKQDKNWSIELVLQAVSIVDKIDCLVLATSDPIYRPLIPWIEAHGVKVHVISCNIPKLLFEIALSTEIPKELNETLTTAQQMELPADSTGDGAGQIS